MGLLRGIVGLAGKAVGRLAKGTTRVVTRTARTAVRHPHVTGFIAGAAVDHAIMKHELKKGEIKTHKLSTSNRKIKYSEEYEVEEDGNDKVLLKDYIKNNGKSKIKFKF